MRPAADRAREAAARKDWQTAAPLYREAVAAAPGDVPLHYELGVAATYVEDREEAQREMRWVVANGSPDSQEYRLAKAWLGEAVTASNPATGTGAPARGRP